MTRTSRFYLTSWPRPVVSVGHWISVYGWYGNYTGNDTARIYYTDSSRDEGGGTGKYWDPTRHIAAADQGAHPGVRLVKAGRRSLVVVLGLVGGVVACSVATPPIPSPSRGARASADSSTTPAAATASPPAASREPIGELGQEIEIGSLDPAWTTADARGRQRRRGDDLLVRRCGRAWRGGRAGPLALPARRGRAGARVAESAARPRACPDRRRDWYVGIRRHRDPRRAGVGPVAPARSRGGAHPARLASGRRGGLEPGAELRGPPGTRSPGRRSTAGRTARSHSCFTRAPRNGSPSSSRSATPAGPSSGCLPFETPRSRTPR